MVTKLFTIIITLLTLTIIKFLNHVLKIISFFQKYNFRIGKFNSKIIS